MLRTAITTTLTFSLAGALHAQALGSFTTSGTGCPQGSSLLYEIWDLAATPAQNFDLDQTALEWIPNGVGCYIVISGGTMLPAGPNRVDTGSGDDQVTGPWALGFPFVDAVGTVHTDAGVSSNGYLYPTFGSTTSSRCCNGNTALPSFLNDGASFAVFGQDLNPSTTSTTGGGMLFFDTDTVNNQQVAYWTWDMVSEFGNAGSANTCQIQLWDDGRCVMVWSGVANLTHDVLVGWSVGGGVTDTGPSDFSNLPIDCGIQGAPVEVDSVGRPTLGQTTVIDITSLPSSTVSSALLVGFTQISVPLDILGMENCTLFTPGQLGAIGVSNLNVGAGTASVSLPIGNDPAFDGVTFFTQAIGIAPQATTLGAVASNLGTMLIGSRTPRASVETSGTNTFSSNGFWKVTNEPNSGVDITGVTFDWAGSSNPAQASMLFDTDQTGMADRFDGGNSAVAGCLGTYRNGSDTATGLIYAGTGSAACDAAAMCGWTTTGTVGGSNTDVSFAFTSFNPGDVFQWDMDTDGGVGVAGDDMDGCVVTITYSDGTSATAEIRAIAPDLGGVAL